MGCLLLMLAEAAVGQSLRPALEVGIPFTAYFDTGAPQGGLHGSAEYSAATRRYTFGASVEWRMPERFGLYGGVLYRRMGYVALVNFFDSANGNFRNTAIDVKGDSWDFPLMLRYHLHGPPRLFIAGGGVLRYIGPVRGRGTETTGSLVSGSSSTIALDTSDPSELRYTRWTANISGEGGLLRFAPDQVELLVGLTF